MSSYPASVTQLAVEAVAMAKRSGSMPPPFTAAMTIPLRVEARADGRIDLIHASTGQRLGQAATAAIAQKTVDFFK